MKRFWILVPVLVLSSCDLSRTYDQHVDFEEKAWMVQDKPRFEFEINDTAQKYNLYCTVRNSLDFPFSRIFVNYALEGPAHELLHKELLSAYLFDQKTGKPFGDSGIGDLFDHRFPIATNYHFDKPGKYAITLEQFNRLDTLKGILAVGVRVEKATNQ